jgi:hypothetical protein
MPGAFGQRGDRGDWKGKAMFYRIEELWHGPLSPSSPDRCFVVALLLIACAGVGCCNTGTTTMIPLCPEPSDEMLHEIIDDRVGPATLEHLSRQENHCHALLSLGYE